MSCDKLCTDLCASVEIHAGAPREQEQVGRDVTVLLLLLGAAAE